MLKLLEIEQDLDVIILLEKYVYEHCFAAFRGGKRMLECTNHNDAS